MKPESKKVQAGLEKVNHPALKNTSLCEISFHSQSLFPLYCLSLKTETGEIKKAALKEVQSASMAQTECSGLRKIKKAGAFAPECYGVLTIENKNFLVMEFIESGSSVSSRDLSRELSINSFSSALAENLLTLYKNTNGKFGWETDNYIGTLPQPNCWYESFTAFWQESRINPQLQIAASSGSLSLQECRELKEVIIGCAKAWGLDELKPRLIHGDLWSGNILTDSRGRPCLIDPCPSYSNPEQDLGMLGLFGSCLSSSQKEKIAQEVGGGPNFSERNAFWQIYPLLVHVNIFGSSYLAQLHQAVRSCA